MIKVNETGELEIYLQGKSPASSFGRLGFGILVCTLLISMIVYLITHNAVVTFLIFGFGVFISFAPMLLQPKKNLITEGLVRVSKGLISHELHGNTTVFEFTQITNKIMEDNGVIVLQIVQSKPEDKLLLISGFEYKREAEVMLASLEGKKINVRKQEIKMQAKN